MSDIKAYFPEFSSKQLELFDRLQPLYKHWNDQINVISRKDMEHFNEHHVLHSLAIAKCISFKQKEKVLDVGTGGGFPGIPLAIAFPDTQFVLVDSIQKKIKVVQEVVNALGLKNVVAKSARVEEIQEKDFQYVVSRAVARVAKLAPWLKGKLKHDVKGNLDGGIYLLKGGDELKEEIKEAKINGKIIPISNYFEGEFFETKKVVRIKRLSPRYL
ncbi:MAG: 16S rRNA (guanine(527)-N(7))-methyltransferase RsmG [Luteibaculum sp.]